MKQILAIFLMLYIMLVPSHPQAQSYYVEPNTKASNNNNQSYSETQAYPAQTYGQGQNYSPQPYAQDQWYPSESYAQTSVYNREPYYQEPQAQPCNVVTCCSKSWSGSLELRVADFYPLSSDMRRIYDSGIPFYQIEASYSANGPVSGWFNVGYLGRSGRSIGEADRTYLRLLPIGLGLKYSFYLPYCWQGYIGAGPTYTFLRIHDHSHFNKHIHRSCLGGMVKTGLTYEFWRCAQVDFFVDYYYTKFNFSGNRNCIRRNDLDASALIFGAGLGWSF